MKPPVRLAILVLACCAFLAACGTLPRAAPGVPHPRRAVGPRALVILHRWDARRARAWAAADPTGLRSLYAPGSVAGERDAALLRMYAARGYRVRGLTTQVLRARVLIDRPGLIRIELTDRLAAAIATSAEGVAISLPATSARRRMVELRREHGDWVADRVVLLSAGSQPPGSR